MSEVNELREKLMEVINHLNKNDEEESEGNPEGPRPEEINGELQKNRKGKGKRRSYRRSAKQTSEETGATDTIQKVE